MAGSWIYTCYGAKQASAKARDRFGPGTRLSLYSDR